MDVVDHHHVIPDMYTSLVKVMPVIGRVSDPSRDATGLDQDIGSLNLRCVPSLGRLGLVAVRLGAFVLRRIVALRGHVCKCALRRSVDQVKRSLTLSGYGRPERVSGTEIDGDCGVCRDRFPSLNVLARGHL